MKAELEILSLHEKLDELSEKKWVELIVLQQEQMQLLIQLLPKRGGVAEVLKNTEGAKTGK